MPPSEISKAYLYAADSDGNPWSPGWVTLNFRFSADLIKTITVNAGVENILNKQYRPYSSGIVSPGRNIVISARFRF
jgi:hemoglobin/transferrin/lactoferrin receptor protein